MADVSNALLPSTEPESRVPDSYIHVNARPDSFGALIGQGAQKLGQGLEQASTNAFGISQFYGKVAVDDQVNKVMEGWNTLSRGAAGATVQGPDGNPQPDTGYLGTSGAEAMRARKGVEQNLDALIDTARKNLTSPEQQLEFDTMTRRMRQRWGEQIGAHADGQTKVWAQGVNASSARVNLDGYLNNLGDAETKSHFARDYIDARVKQAQLQYGADDAITAQAVSTAKRELIKAEVESVKVTDPVGAQRILDKNRAIMGTDYAGIAEGLRGRVDQQEGITAADRMVTSHAGRPYASAANPVYERTAGEVPGGMSAQGLARTVQIESSGNPLSANASDHVGLGQFSAATAQQVGITDRRDPEQSVRGIARYAAQNAPILQKVLGRAPTDAELYLAHQQGPGAAAKLLANPDKRAGDLVGDAAIRQNGGNPDAPASAFVALWNSKFGQAPAQFGSPATTIARSEGDIKLAILSDPAMTARPQMQSAALSRVGQIFAAQRETLAQDTAAFKLRYQNTTAEALDTGAVQNPMSADEFNAVYGPAEGARRYAEYQATVQLGADIRATASMGPEQLSALRTSYLPQPGSDNYAAQEQRIAQLDKAIAQNDQQKAKDPPDFLIRRTDVGAAAFKQFQTVLSDPKASPEARSIAANMFAEKMRAEQERLGVAPEQIKVVPDWYVEQIAAKLNMPAQNGGSGAVADLIQSEAKLWGHSWPDVFRQVNKDLKPVVRVIGSGVKASAAQSLVNLDKLTLPDILKDQDTEKVSQIKRDVLDAMKPLARSMLGNDGASPVFNDFRGQAEKLAAQYVVDGMDSATAGRTAFEQLVGFKYTFQDGYRIPKQLGLDPAAIAAGTVDALNGLKASEIMPADDTMGGLSEDYRAKATMWSLQRDGKWATLPDEKGVALIHNGQAWRFRDGRPISFTWKQLSDLGIARLRSIDAGAKEGFNP